MGVSYGLIVDSLEITIKPHKALYSHLYSQLHGGWSDLQGVLVPHGKITFQKKEYCLTMRYYPTMAQLIAQLTVGFTKSGGRYFKLRLEVGSMTKGDFVRFQEHLFALMPDVSYKKLFETGRVTRIDLAVDSLSHEAHSFIPFKPLVTTSSVFMENNGERGTVYIGSNASKVMYRIYDKKKQLLAVKKQKTGLKIRTRFEAVLRNLGCPPKDLWFELKDPFAGLSIASLDAAKAQDADAAWHAFLTDCLDRGAPSALKSLPTKAVKAIYRKRLAASAAPWWTPNSYWHGLQGALEAIVPAALEG